jgi:hypothetical protein
MRLTSRATNRLPSYQSFVHRVQLHFNVIISLSPLSADLGAQSRATNRLPSYQSFVHRVQLHFNVIISLSPLSADLGAQSRATNRLPSYQSFVHRVQFIRALPSAMLFSSHFRLNRYCVYILATKPY